MSSANEEFKNMPENGENEEYEEDLLPDEVYYAVLELLSYAQKTGHSIDQDDTTVPAVQHVIRLAQDGDAEAEFLAARYYIMNSSDERELERAITWLEFAVDAGHEEAIRFMEDLKKG